MKNEPLLTAAGLGAAVAALLGLLVSFGIPLTDDQQQAILAFVAVVGPIVVAAAARHLVTPHDRVAAYETKAGVVVAGPASPVPDGTPVDVEQNAELGVEESETEDLDEEFGEDEFTEAELD